MNELAYNLSDELYLSANLQAFLRVIREGETSQDEKAYYTMVGGDVISSLRDHPRRVIWIDRLGVWSSAAGAYQFIRSTWDSCVDALNLPDFGYQSQDIAAVYLVKRRHALDLVKEGKLEEAIERCAAEWASLPGDYYGQGGIEMKRAKDVFVTYGGTLEDEH